MDSFSIIMPKISKGHRYVTILDAGSSSTRIYIYRYATDDAGRTITPLELTLVYDKDSGGSGLHLQDDEVKVKDHLKPLLDDAKKELIKFGAHNVPIYLLATQGMRDLGNTNNDLKIQILDFVQAVMDAEKYDDTTQHDIFQLGSIPTEENQPDRSARVIPGYVEGLLAWVSVNHGFAGDRDPTIGIFEMGGASSQIAFDKTDPATGADVKDVCLRTGTHKVYTKSWPDYGATTLWGRLLDKISDGDGDGPFDHPCLRPGENIEVGANTFTGTAAGDGDEKWNACLEIMTSLVGNGVAVAEARTRFFYGLGKPIFSNLKALEAGDTSNDRIFPVSYNHDQFITKAKDWCKTAKVGEDADDFVKRRCTIAAWIVKLLQGTSIYPNDNLRNKLYIPTQRETRARASWTMGAAALIARAQNSARPGLKGCDHHPHGLEVLGIFNGSTDGMEDVFVAPAVEPAFDDGFYDEVFTTNTQLVESSYVPSSAKFIHSLSDNNFITAQFSLSFANFAFFVAMLVAIGAWVYKRRSRRATPNISLPGDMVKI